MSGPGHRPEIRVSATKGDLARDIAGALSRLLAQAQGARDTATMVLTGGSMGAALMQALATEAPAGAPGDTPDWGRVEVWWSDERFLAAGDAERNDSQAASAGMDALGLAPARVHRSPTPGECGGDVDAAAGRYAAALRAAAMDPAAALPRIDVLMLGVGPDGHVASLFPGHPALAVTDRTVVGVVGSPKPPSRRVSWTLPALCRAARVWLLVAGHDKAAAVSAALAGASVGEIPAAGVHGRLSTTWWLDAAAAAGASSGGAGGEAV